MREWESRRGYGEQIEYFIEIKRLHIYLTLNTCSWFQMQRQKPLGIKLRRKCHQESTA